MQLASEPDCPTFDLACGEFRGREKQKRQVVTNLEAVECREHSLRANVGAILGPENLSLAPDNDESLKAESAESM